MSFKTFAKADAARKQMFAAIHEAGHRALGGLVAELGRFTARSSPINDLALYLQSSRSIKEAFAELDSDGDRAVSVQEIANYDGLGIDAIRELMATIHTEIDGPIEGTIVVRPLGGGPYVKVFSGGN